MLADKAAAIGDRPFLRYSGRVISYATVIEDHPQVREVAVFGVPHDQWGETPMAVCTIEPGATVTEAEIITLVTDRLGSYKKPSRVEFTTDPLPKSVVGKLQRKVLREPHWAGHQRRVGGA